MTTTTMVPTATSALLRKSVPTAGAWKMAEYEDKLSPPVGSQALAERY